MPKTRTQKESIVSSLQEEVNGMKSAVFFNYFGLPVKEINLLRNDCRKENIGYKVAKKTLLKKVLAEKGYDADLSGEVAVLFGRQDEVAPAKVIAAFAKTHDKAKIVGGVLEGQFITADKVKALSRLPSKQELLAKVVGSIASPLSGFVNVLQGNLRGLVYTLNAIKEKKS